MNSPRHPPEALVVPPPPKVSDKVTDRLAAADPPPPAMRDINSIALPMLDVWMLAPPTPPQLLPYGASGSSSPILLEEEIPNDCSRISCVAAF